jgi:hypothetical protein
MNLAERRIVNAPDVEIMPGVFVPLHKALAAVKAIQLDYPKVRKADLIPSAQEFRL